jgi:hypothetical protein
MTSLFPSFAAERLTAIRIPPGPFACLEYGKTKELHEVILHVL